MRTIEQHKTRTDGRNVGRIADERDEIETSLASSAALVVGIGPLLTKYAHDLVIDKDNPPQIAEIVPGFSLQRKALTPLPQQVQCLVIARAEDAVLKGIPLALCAMGKLSPEIRDLTIAVRGVADQHINTFVTDHQIHLSPRDDIRIEPRSYTTNAETLRRDRLRASLILMPSREEGFGLVVWEALQCGVPVLVSSRCGVSTLLNGAEGTEFVVDSFDDSRWAVKIEEILFNREKSFALAAKVARELARLWPWEHTLHPLITKLHELIVSEDGGTAP